MKRLEESGGSKYGIHKEKPVRMERPAPVGTNYVPIKPKEEISMLKGQGSSARKDFEEKARMEELRRKEMDVNRARDEETKRRKEQETREKEEVRRRREQELRDEERKRNEVERRRDEEERRGEEEERRREEGERKREEGERRREEEERRRNEEIQVQTQRERERESEEIEKREDALRLQREKEEEERKREQEERKREQEERRKEQKAREAEHGEEQLKELNILKYELKAEWLNVRPAEKAINQVTAIAMYDYAAEVDNEISLTEGQTIKNIDTSDPDWWSGTLPDGSTGLFPASYVRLLSNSQQCAVALYDFVASAPDEITLKEGETITEIEKESDDWWMGTNTDGKRGIFPSNYVKLS